MKAQSGFTLVELVLVVAILGIIATMVTLNFSRLNEKYRVESTAKEIYSLLMKARNDAANTNISYQVTPAANQIQTAQDRNKNGDFTDPVDETVTIAFPRFTINFYSAIVFDRRGMTNNNQTIRLTGYTAGIEPAMDCIVVANTRINIGKWDESKPPGEKCVQR